MRAQRASRSPDLYKECVEGTVSNELYGLPLDTATFELHSRPPQSKITSEKRPGAVDCHGSILLRSSFQTSWLDSALQRHLVQKAGSMHILHPIHTRIHPVPIPTILPYRKARCLEVPERSAASSCIGHSPFFAAAGTLIGCCSLPMTDADPRQRDTILEQRCDHTQVYSYRERILCRTADVLKTVPIIVENRS
ncbi:unnamed protein product [Nesidiocoris tenuis]|uniref:Uncharacterized protein n=1 Tax=Nesidiocoris tenuis TaxID=355587 RepID=A0A6H5HPN7_9HEMI|nr:unnamed protein product [Nesidiocoris tenuis]